MAKKKKKLNRGAFKTLTPYEKWMRDEMRRIRQRKKSEHLAQLDTSSIEDEDEDGTRMR